MPSETSITLDPAVAGIMAVAAALPASDDTLADAETTVNAAVFFILIIRPAEVAAEGSVTVMVAPPLQIIMFSFAATVNDVVRSVGAPNEGALINGAVRVGVVRVGFVENTSGPVPVSSVIVAAKFAEVGLAKNAAMSEAMPDTPVDIGRLMQLVRSPLNGVPRRGATNVGALLNTSTPEPVSSTMAAISCADVAPERNAAIPAERPLTPVAIGRPVQFARFPDAGVPSAGDTNTGLLRVLFERV